MVNKAFCCPVCGGRMVAVQCAGLGGTKRPVTRRKYCPKCDRVWRMVVDFSGDE